MHKCCNSIGSFWGCFRGSFSLWYSRVPFEGKTFLGGIFVDKNLSMFGHVYIHIIMYRTYNCVYI